MSEDYKRLAARLLSLTPAELGRLNDFERTVYTRLSTLTSEEKELLLAYQQGEIPQGEPDFLLARMLLLSLQTMTELSMYRKVSRATTGELSTAIENILQDLTNHVRDLEREVGLLTQSLLRAEDGIEKIKLLSRQQGMLEQQIKDFRIFHFAQLVRDTQTGSKPQPLEILCAIQPRSLDSYIDMLQGEERYPEEKRRTRRPKILNECMKLCSAWQKEFEGQSASAQELQALEMGLALAGKIAVETIGIKILLQGKTKDMFLGHIEKLFQQNRLSHSKFQSQIKKAKEEASGLVQKRLAVLEKRVDMAYLSLADAVSTVFHTL